MTNFRNFQVIEAETKDLVLDLMENADRQRSAFMSFVNIWMAFNGWMAAVTERETAADMIRDIAANKRLISAYDELVENSQAFRRLVLDFAAMWPVLNVRDVRKKLGRDAFWRLEREAAQAVHCPSTQPQVQAKRPSHRGQSCRFCRAEGKAL